MAASFFMPMVNVFGPESPLSGSTYVIQNIDAAADVSFLLLIVLPHLFGVLIVLGALLGRAARPLAGIRAGVRVHLILWFCAHAFTLWRAWMSGAFSARPPPWPGDPGFSCCSSCRVSEWRRDAIPPDGAAAAVVPRVVAARLYRGTPTSAPSAPICSCCATESHPA